MDFLLSSTYRAYHGTDRSYLVSPVLELIEQFTNPGIERIGLSLRPQMEQEYSTAEPGIGPLIEGQDLVHDLFGTQVECGTFVGYPVQAIKALVRL